MWEWGYVELLVNDSYISALFLSVHRDGKERGLDTIKLIIEEMGWLVRFDNTEPMSFTHFQSAFTFLEVDVPLHLLQDF